MRSMGCVFRRDVFWIATTVLLLAGLASPALAQDQETALPCGDSIVVPAGSPVSLSKIGGESGGSGCDVTFQGRFLVTGTFYYGDGEFNDSGKFYGEAWIVPDLHSLPPLPHFSSSWESGPPIYIDNGDSFARAILPANVLAKVARKGGSHASGHVAIWVEDFAGDKVCGGPSFSARFLSVQAPATVRLAANAPDKGC